MTSEQPLIPTNLASLDPADQNSVLEEISQEFADRYTEDQKDLVESGALTFRHLPPKERLQGYMQDTLAGDLELILDPDYLAKRRLGIAPPLQAEQLQDERAQLQAQYDQAAMQGQAMGMPPPPQPPLPPEVPPLWPGLLPSDLRPANPFNSFFFEFFQRDFLKLIKGVAE